MYGFKMLSLVRGRVWCTTLHFAALCAVAIVCLTNEHVGERCLHSAAGLFGGVLGVKRFSPLGYSLEHYQV